MSGYGAPTGHQPAAGAGQIMPMNREGYVAGPANSSMAAVAQLFARLSQEIEEQQPPNSIHFIVNFLCKHYPEHLHGFASIWNMDPDLERERHEVVNFFKSHKISTAVAAHFTNAGYDTLDTLTTLSPDQLVDVEAFNNVKWLPGHKVRLQQIFSEIPARIRAYRQAHPNDTRAIVGREGGNYSESREYSPRASRPYEPSGQSRAIAPQMPHSIAGARASPSLALSNAPAGPREYVVGVSEPVRVGGGAMPQAIMPPMGAMQVNPYGAAEPHFNFAASPGPMQMPGHAAVNRGAPLHQQPSGASMHMTPQGMQLPGGGMQAPMFR